MASRRITAATISGSGGGGGGGTRGDGVAIIGTTSSTTTSSGNLRQGSVGGTTSGTKIKLSQIIFIFVAFVFIIFTLLIHIIIEQQHEQQAALLMDRTTSSSSKRRRPTSSTGVGSRPVNPNGSYGSSSKNEFNNNSASTTKKRNVLNKETNMVENEKKLKRELKKLMEIQTTQRKCLSIPIETRWKGDNIPVWVCDEIGLSNLGPLDKTTTQTTTSLSAEETTTTTTTSSQNEVDVANRSNRDLAYPLPNTLTESTKQQLQSDGAFVTVEHPPTSSKVILEPTYGTHRSNMDAVFAFAQGYDLKTFVGFIQTLVDTGFKGDIVLSVSTLETLQPGVKDYLEYMIFEEHVSIVVYAVHWECYKKSGIPINTPTGESDCNLVGMYGDGTTGEPLKDPRFRRPLATARFELYWAWTLQYEPNALILLMDFRDAYFQRLPFEGIERSTTTNDNSKTKKAARIYLYEEHSSTPIGKSSFNSQWLRQAYGGSVANAMKDYTVICSGSTIGEQAALEPYLRAMIAQYDKTLCKRKGCDQGFHNYIVYNGVLEEISSHDDETVNIEPIKVPQGHGTINNLGILRDQKLSDLGLYDKQTRLVYNWDKTVSPVVHQFDRDDELKVMMREKLSQMVMNYQQKVRNK